MFGLTVAYIIAFCITIAFLYKNKGWAYAAMKTATSLIFLAIGFYAYKISGNSEYFTLLPGFVLCFCGDVFLALAHEIDNRLKNPQFLLGVGCFAIAHSVFCLALWSMFGLGLFAASASLAVACAAVLYTWHTTKNPKYDYGINKLSSVAYSFFVGLLCGTGIVLLPEINTGGAALASAAGAVAFLVSDLILSNKLFRKNPPKILGFFVLFTYYGAMYALSINILF